VLVRDPLAEFKPQALLSTNLESDPVEMLGWFVRRWAVEVAFEEARAHLGMETQRQWSDKAIARTTPAVLALFSIVTLLGNHRYGKQPEQFVRQSAWYVKRLPTFSDALATVREQLWREADFRTSRSEADSVKVDRALLERLTDALCYAA
ncbi:MAG: IS701 family transposase, partial [Pyrinomonadaceae bacterium]